jgi:type VI secretion system protein ImpE
MQAADFIREGRVQEALVSLQGEIRANPADSKLRVFLFQLNCVLGAWEKALTQLQVVASLNAETMLMAQIFRPLILCEMLRAEVFAGKRSALIFGDPAEWVGSLVQATALLAQGNAKAASELRARAFDAAPATAGSLNGDAFAWISDADSRLGPVLEAIVDGKYYWVPFCRIARIELEKPVDLRDLVWLPVRFTWTNGGMVPGHIPVRYPGSEFEVADDAVRLARKTAWSDAGEETFVGLGQRLFATDAGETPLLECRTIEMTPVP